MAKALPCPQCGTAKLKERGVLVDYVMGRPPACFSGAALHPFVYRCAHMEKTPLCKSLKLTQREWMALPDLEVPNAVQ